MTIYHRHHIIPRYMGGTDDPSNLVKLTVKEHAAAHKKLWEEYGDIRDKLAWQGLLGIVSKEEIVSKLTNNAKGSKWYYNPENSNERKMIKPTQEIPEGWLPGRGNNTWTKNRDYKNVSAEHREKTSKSMKKAWEKGFHRDQSHMKRDSRGRWKQFEQGD